MATQFDFILNGTVTIPFKDFEKTSILATFENKNVQANITTTEVEFVNENAEILRDYVQGGLTGATAGVYEGIPFGINLTGASGVYTAFNGFVDTVSGFKRLNPTTYAAKLINEGNLRNIQDRARVTTYEALFQKGAITSADFLSIPYIVEKRDTAFEVAMMGFATYNLLVQLISEIRRTGTVISDAIAHISGGSTGGIAAAIYVIAVALLQAAYVTLLVIYTVNMLNDFITLLISPVKFHKGIKVKTLIEKGLAELGYSFSSSIPEFDDLVYLPSKKNISIEGQFSKILQNFTVNQPGNGYPNTNDFGFTLAEMLELCNMNFFNARLAVKGNTVFMEPLISNWWIQNASYVMPNVLDESIVHNADELKGTRLNIFSVDETDVFTLENYTGTAYEIKTDVISANNQRRVLIKGLEENQIPVALGNRKESLTTLENSIKNLASLADSFVNFFGGNSQLASKILARVGMLKVETDFIAKAKVMRLDGSNKLPANHRAIWSAKHLEDNYHNEKSFVRNGFGNQYQLFTDLKIPFGFEDFLKVIDNSYFTTVDGRQGKIEKLAWTIDQDFAVATFRVQETFTTNITETFIEP